MMTASELKIVLEFHPKLLFLLFIVLFMRGVVLDKLLPLKRTSSVTINHSIGELVQA